MLCCQSAPLNPKRRTGLEGRGDEAYAAVQDLIANLMRLCEQAEIAGGEVTFASLGLHGRDTLSGGTEHMLKIKRGAYSGPAAVFGHA